MEQTIIQQAFRAAEAGDTDGLRSLLQQTPGLANAENADGLTLLGYAAHFGQKDAISTLLEWGANINATSHSKLSFIPSNTALHAAIAGNCNTEAVALLIERGADVNALDSLGHTPLQAAAFEGNVDVAQLLLNRAANLHSGKGGSDTAIAIATKRGHHEFAELLRRHQQQRQDEPID